MRHGSLSAARASCTAGVQRDGLHGECVAKSWSSRGALRLCIVLSRVSDRELELCTCSSMPVWKMSGSAS